MEAKYYIVSQSSLRSSISSFFGNQWISPETVKNAWHDLDTTIKVFLSREDALHFSNRLNHNQHDFGNQLAIIFEVELAANAGFKIDEESFPKRELNYDHKAITFFEISINHLSYLNHFTYLGKNQLISTRLDNPAVFIYEDLSKSCILS